jgi:hypothetical protein
MTSSSKLDSQLSSQGNDKEIETMAEQFTPLAEAEEVIAYRGGPDGDQLRYTRMDEEGNHYGYIYSPEFDRKNPEALIETILSHGYWEAPEGATFIANSEDDEEELARIGLAVVTALVYEDEIIAVNYAILGTDETYYRVDGDWAMFPDRETDFEDLEEYVIEPESVDAFLAEYDKKDPELFGKIAEYEASDSFIKKAFPKSRNV